MTNRDDQARLADLLEAIERIARYHPQVGSTSPMADADMIRDAILYNFVVIGEAVRSLSDQAKSLAPEIPWQEIVGLRNFLTHQYFQVQIETIRQVIEFHLPALRGAITKMQRP